MPISKYYAILGLLLLSACSESLVKPLSGGKVMAIPRGRVLLGATRYIVRGKSKIVRAAEACQVMTIVKREDSSLMILTKGKYAIVYGNLQSCSVKNGTNIEKGEIIGELFDANSDHSSLLEIAIRRNDTNYWPNW